MALPVDEDLLVKYLSGQVDLATRQRIAIERKKPGSPIHAWFERAFRRLNDPMNVDWLAVASDAMEVGDTAPSAAIDPTQDTHEPLSETAADFQEEVDPAEDETWTDSLEPLVAEYMRRELRELRAELVSLSEEVRSDPLAPHRADLRRVVCSEWNWNSRRNDSRWQDKGLLAIELANVLQQSQIDLPFPIPLVAVFLVRQGLDSLCNPFR